MGTGVLLMRLVECGEDFGAGGFVGDGEGAVDRPVVVDGAAGGGDGAEGLLEALTVFGLLAELDVGEEAEAGAAPVGAGPGGGMVEAAVAVAWIALRHVADHVGPDELSDRAGLIARGRWVRRRRRCLLRASGSLRGARGGWCG